MDSVVFGPFLMWIGKAFSGSYRGDVQAVVPIDGINLLLYQTYAYGYNPELLSLPTTQESELLCPGFLSVPETQRNGTTVHILGNRDFKVTHLQRLITCSDDISFAGIHNSFGCCSPLHNRSSHRGTAQINYGRLSPIRTDTRY